MLERVVALARTHEEKLRFLVVGFMNTVFGYCLFAVLLYVFGKQRYNLALVTQWVISVTFSYTMFKLFVFKTRGTNWVKEWVRSYVVYAATLGVNLLVLNAFVKLAHLDPLVAQAASILIVTIMSYLGHKHFTFGAARHAIEAIDGGDVFEHED